MAVKYNLHEHNCITASHIYRITPNQLVNRFWRLRTCRLHHCNFCLGISKILAPVWLNFLNVHEAILVAVLSWLGRQRFQVVERIILQFVMCNAYGIYAGSSQFVYFWLAMQQAVIVFCNMLFYGWAQKGLSIEVCPIYLLENRIEATWRPWYLSYRRCPSFRFMLGCLVSKVGRSPSFIFAYIGKSMLLADFNYFQLGITLFKPRRIHMILWHNRVTAMKQSTGTLYFLH